MSMQPRRIVVASLFEHEAQTACETLRTEFGDSVAFVPEWGNLFVPSALSGVSRKDLIQDPVKRRQLLCSLYDDFEAAYEDNHLATMIRQHRPEVIVDCVNTATGISYQDVFDVRQKVQSGSVKRRVGCGVQDLEALLLSQTGPQLIHHAICASRNIRYPTRCTSKLEQLELVVWTQYSVHSL